VSRPHFKRRFLILLIAAAVFALLLYAVYAFEQALRTYFMSHMGLLATSESVGTVLNVIKIVLCMGLAVVFVRALNEAIFGLNFRFRKKPQAPGLVRNIFSIIAYVLIFVILFKAYYPRVDLGAVFTTSAIFGVILGLALQDTLGNLFAGLSLQADNPFQVGDVIVVGQQKWTGVVEGISWRAVKVRTFSNHVLVLSNSSIAKEAIEVCPKDNLNARLVYFSTLYTDSPARTIHVVREAVREADNVSQMIRPNVRIRNLGESGVEYEVKYWLEDYAKYNDTDALVRQRIWYAFRRAGLNFAFPTRTLQIERKAKTGGLDSDGRNLIERLSAVDIFAPLSAEETSRLAAAAVSHVFAQGEIVIRAGDEGSSMFVVHRGRVQVQVADNGKPRTVAVLKEGDFFGEMALLRGEPRAANVVAMEETEVLEIGHQAMKHLFEINPDLVESLSHTITERRIGLVALPESAETASAESAGVMSAIKRFFGLD
jgi:small-conductance mechanosensitive channel/CRP-like cAMP-binding protein